MLNNRQDFEYNEKCGYKLFPQCVQRDSGVRAAPKLVQFARMEACVINTMGRVSVVQGSWVQSARIVSPCLVSIVMCVRK